MNPPCCRPDRTGNIFEKSNHIVIRPLFNLQDFRNGKARTLPNLRSILLRNLAEFRHRLAGKNLDIQPNLKLALVRPDFAHLWPGITIDHSRNIKAACLRESVLFSMVPSVQALSSKMESGAAAPHSKTRATLKCGDSGPVLECGGAPPLSSRSTRKKRKSLQ